jgi:hypothetical protein
MEIVKSRRQGYIEAMRIDELNMKNDPDMLEEYDFSKAERGKYYRPDMKLNIPIYLDEDVSAFVEKIATKKNLDRSAVVNELLKGDIKLAEAIE